MNTQTTNGTGNLPEKKFRAGTVSATIWLNKGQRPNGDLSEFRTISIERSYTDKEGKWQNTNSFRINDLPKLAMIGMEAYKYLICKEQELFKGE